MLSYPARQVTSSYEIASKRIQGLLEAYFKINKSKNSDEQEKEFIIRVREGYNNLSLWIPVCHHSACLVMPNGDPWDRFFYPTLTLMIDSYIPILDCYSVQDLAV